MLKCLIKCTACVLLTYSLSVMICKYLGFELKITVSKEKKEQQ